MRIRALLPVATALFLGVPASLAAAEPSDNERVLWQHEFGAFPHGFFLRVAGIDGQGNLWVLSDAYAEPRGNARRRTLFCIDGSGRQQSAIDVEAPLPEDKDEDAPEYRPAIGADGPAGFLINRTRSHGRAIEERGTFYAPLAKSGVVGKSTPLSGAGGPLFWHIVPLSDGDFVAVGEQSPLLLVKLSPTGEIRWRRRFWQGFRLISVAALDEGRSRVVTSSTPGHLLEFQLDAKGLLLRQTRGRGDPGDAAADRERRYAVFSGDLDPRDGRRARYRLTLFDAALRRQRTSEIPPEIAGPYGRSSYFVALRDGYLAAGITWSDELFLARYTGSGELRWLETREQVWGLEDIVPSADGFYLIAETHPPQGPPTSFTVTRIAVLR